MKINLTPSRIKRLRPGSREFTIWDATTPHFGVRVLPSGAMRFIHIATIKGRLRKTTVGDAARMPVEDARAIARDLEDGAAGTDTTCPTFGEWVGVWWSHASPHLKPSTRKDYQHLLGKRLLPAFGEKRLDGVGRTEILDWFEPYSQNAPGRANKALKVLGAILNHARRAEVIPNNPVRGIRRNPGRKMTRFLSVEERGRLHSVLAARSPTRRVRMMVEMLLYTGCRLNEILSLRWDEVGMGELNLRDGKTGARKVWFGPEARAVIDEAKSLQEAMGGSEFVFPHPRDPRRGLDPNGFGQFWRRLRRRAGLEDVRLHDLRHSFASEAVRQGVPLPVVSKLLGHSSITMTMRYVHASNAEIEAAAERIGNGLSYLLEKKH